MLILRLADLPLAQESGDHCCDETYSGQHNNQHGHVVTRSIFLIGTAHIGGVISRFSPGLQHWTFRLVRLRGGAYNTLADVDVSDLKSVDYALEQDTSVFANLALAAPSINHCLRVDQTFVIIGRVVCLARV